MLYPLKFYPILKQKIWGGEKLKNLLHKKTNKKNIGESWEISTIENYVSVVSNGSLKGKDLIEIIRLYKGDLIGKEIYKKFGDQFPLLFKFIDAKKDLSIQVHPNDKIALKKHNSFGKTEMWYVLQADQNAKLIVGFKKDTSRNEYEKYLKKEKILELLNFEEIVKGDSYIIQAGKIHAIGEGALIVEIQQTSDITYRVYDWKREDKNGNQRELHTNLALDALDFSGKQDFKLNYDSSSLKSNLISLDYFTTNILSIKDRLKKDYSTINSFVVLILVKGNGMINGDGFDIELLFGEVVLVPYCINNLIIINKGSSSLELLEVYI